MVTTDGGGDLTDRDRVVGELSTDHVDCGREGIPADLLERLNLPNCTFINTVEEGALRSSGQ